MRRPDLVGRRPGRSRPHPLQRRRSRFPNGGCRRGYHAEVESIPSGSARGPVVAASTLLLAASFAVAGAEPGRGADWPGLLGPDRNGVAAEETPIGWEGERPPELWSRAVGSGWSGPAVADGRVFVFHREGDEEVLEALDRSTGEVLWRSARPTSYRDDFGFDEGPRATPEVSGGRVVTFGAEGLLASRRVVDGEIEWSLDVRDVYGPRKPFFGVGATPLFVGEVLVVPVGSPDGAGLVAVDAATGAERWRATDHEVSYSSPIRARIGRRERVFAFTRDGVAPRTAGSGASSR